MGWGQSRSFAKIVPIPKNYISTLHQHWFNIVSTLPMFNQLGTNVEMLEIDVSTLLQHWFNIVSTLPLLNQLGINVEMLGIDISTKVTKI